MGFPGRTWGKAIDLVEAECYNYTNECRVERVSWEYYVADVECWCFNGVDG